ncbi:hypothetical protein [Zhihengliuella sp.]|uniref:hypothetical protein n=1 Tax=Zhihengliuella sp. TaxID=1954483 RepID=UPI002811FE74|nr:hypothetical protein [Zhihengliuella sp.]
MTADRASSTVQPLQQHGSDCSHWRESTTAGLVQAALTGAATLVDPTTFRPATRRCFRAGLALVVGALGGLGWRSGFRTSFTTAADAHGPDPEGTEQRQSDATAARRASTLGAITVGGLLAGAVYASAAGGAAIDARIHRALTARRVARPRAVMAVGAAVLSWVLFELERRSPQTDPVRTGR